MRWLSGHEADSRRTPAEKLREPSKVACRGRPSGLLVLLSHKSLVSNQDGMHRFRGRSGGIKSLRLENCPPSHCPRCNNCEDRMEVALAVGVFAAVMASISAFSDGQGLVRQWRDKRRARKQAMLLFADQRPLFGPHRPLHLDWYHDDDMDYDRLSANLTTSPRHIQAEYSRLSNVAGPLFGRGDAMALGQMRSGLDRFHQRLIQNISTAIMVTAMDGLLLPVGTLFSETDAFRNSNLSSMAGLFQRVYVVRPIPRGLTAGTGLTGSGMGGSGMAGSGMAGTGLAGGGMAGGGMAGGGLAGTAQLPRGSSVASSCWCERVGGLFLCAFCGKRGGAFS
ncbi:hypothetical protein B0T18DRAFT_116697 [Schizothecium vesticola]|uniref:Uncharacterized protein n=1 Tax=Schizothecium vesticola TaxID=314040 RepID=A0AA40K8Y7_9PEZI|nr:hypothetical protein B0T18DRAFT_116697 [Schizothecium vesticola]